VAKTFINEAGSPAYPHHRIPLIPFERKGPKRGKNVNKHTVTEEQNNIVGSFVYGWWVALFGTNFSVSCTGPTFSIFRYGNILEAEDGGDDGIMETNTQMGDEEAGASDNDQIFVPATKIYEISIATAKGVLSKPKLHKLARVLQYIGDEQVSAWQKVLKNYNK